MELTTTTPMIWNVDTTSFAYKFMTCCELLYFFCIIVLVVSFVLTMCHLLDTNFESATKRKSVRIMVATAFIAAACLIVCPSKEAMVFRYVSKVMIDNNITHMSHYTVRAILEEYRILDTRSTLVTVSPHRIKVRKEDDNSIIVRESGENITW